MEHLDKMLVFRCVIHAGVTVAAVIFLSFTSPVIPAFYFVSHLSAHTVYCTTPIHPMWVTGM